MKESFCTYNGYRVYTDTSMIVISGTIEIKLTWKQRLFSRPWHPLMTHITENTYEPSREVIISETNHMMIMHPHTLKELEKAIKNEQKLREKTS